MRPVLPGDLAAAGCALLRVPPLLRGVAARRMLARADAADRYRLRTGRAHPRWGNGSLMAVALAGGPVGAEPFLDDPDYCAALIVVLRAIMKRRA